MGTSGGHGMGHDPPVQGPRIRRMVWTRHLPPTRCVTKGNWKLRIIILVPRIREKCGILGKGNSLSPTPWGVL